MSSWFYKLGRKRSLGKPANQKPPPPPCPKTPSCSPNRASYYFPSTSRERAQSPRPAKQDNPKLRDTRFPQPGDIVFDVVARRDDMFPAPMHELKLRPILTTRAHGDGSSGAASPTVATRVRRRLAHASTRKAETGTKLRWWVYESVVVVKESAEPEEEFLASMEEMMAAHDVRSPRGLQDLLACYLALNAVDHHRAIVAAFRRAWLHLDRRGTTHHVSDSD